MKEVFFLFFCFLVVLSAMIGCGILVTKFVTPSLIAHYRSSVEKASLSLSETEELLSDIRSNSNDREIMDCVRLHIQGKEEILHGDMLDFYDCKKRVLQERLKRAISEIPNAKN